MSSQSSSAFKYARSGHHSVDGWLSDGAAQLILAIDALQKERRVQGNVGEIGVHHGRLFILLYLLCIENETALAIDVFSMQVLNIDCSGLGNLGKFQANLTRWADSTDRLRLLEADSITVNSAQILQLAEGKIRLFSIDGGHTPEITVNDLQLANDSLADGGVIILDDYFNEQWPGVSEGTNRFFASSGNRLAPFLIGGNKVFLAHEPYAEEYFKAFQPRAIGTSRVEKRFFGRKTQCVNFRPLSPRSYLVETSLWKTIRPFIKRKG